MRPAAELVPCVRGVYPERKRTLMWLQELHALHVAVGGLCPSRSGGTWATFSARHFCVVVAARLIVFSAIPPWRCAHPQEKRRTLEMLLLGGENGILDEARLRGITSTGVPDAGGLRPVLWRFLLRCVLIVVENIR